MVKRSRVRETVQGSHARRVEQDSRRERGLHPDFAPTPGRGRPARLQSSPPAARKSRAALARHARKCSVCKHPDRDAIEHEFLRWHSPDDIAEDYGIADHSSIYRHVHATGIFARRRETVCLALEPLLEQACNVKVNASAIISAFRLYAQFNDAGKWVRPVKTVIVQHVTDPIADPVAPNSQPETPNPNRQIQESKHAPTH
jgi:hypothetical protein